jgi:hypothetical protein
MKLKLIFAVATLFMIVMGVQAQDMVVDFDKSVDFTKFKSFAFDEGLTARNPTTKAQLIAAISGELTSRGLTRNDTAPDVKVVVMAAADLELQGIGPTWNNEVYKSWGGYGNPAAMMTVRKGTLLIDIVQTSNQIGVWRGVVKNVFVMPPSGNAADDAKQMEKLVNKTVKNMFKKYPVKSNI